MRALHVVLIAVLVLGCSSGKRSRPGPATPAAGTPAKAPAAGAPTGTPAPAAGGQAAPTGRQLAADTTLKTRSGATLWVPKGWWVTETGEVLLLEDPERTLKAWIVESREPDGVSAIMAAWRRVVPGFSLASAGAPETPPPTGGWEAILTLGYDTGRGSSRVVDGMARRHGQITYVSLTDGDRAALSRRGPQLERIVESLKPEGMREESLAGRTPRRIDRARAKELDAFIHEARLRLSVPGGAIAVVQRGKVIYERVFGVRALGETKRVSPRTRFLIGSITKPMTTLMQASLVDAGLFTWETPVTSVLPSFALGDAELTRKVAMWHMSCACTGMPRNDVENIFEYERVSPEERVASMKSMKPTTALGETFQYSNLMVMAGGYAAAHALVPNRPLGEAYDAAMQRKIFGPIGMDSTTLDFAAAMRGNHAKPHATTIYGMVRPIPVEMERNVLPIRPAGGVWSSLRDMQRYVMTELAGGVAPSGKRVVSAANMQARRTIRIGDAATGGYGLGLGVGTFQGLPTLSHDGGAFGFGTTMFMLPEQGIGIIVLTNVRNGSPTEHLPFNAVVKQRLIEALFEGARPLSTLQLEYFARGKARAATRAVENLRRTPDAARVGKLAGMYANASLGTATLAATPDGVIFDAGEWRSTLGQRTAAGGALQLVFLEPPFAGAALTVGGDDAKPTLTLADGQMTYVFVRGPAPPSR
jgi:CubicO group peptidase (beta-lactamase class C family)